MAKNKNKSVAPVSVPVVSIEEVVVANLSDVLGEVSEETVINAPTVVEEVVSEIVSEVSETPTESEVTVTVPNSLLANYQRWLTTTVTRKANGGKTPNGKTLGRKPSVFTVPLRLVRHKNSQVFEINGKGRPAVGDVLYTIVVPKSLEITKETKFEVDLVTGDWKVWEAESEIQKVA